MADFVTQHCGVVDALEIIPWTLFFDGSTCDRGAGISMVLISPWGKGKWILALSEFDLRYELAKAVKG